MGDLLKKSKKHKIEEEHICEEEGIEIAGLGDDIGGSDYMGVTFYPETESVLLFGEINDRMFWAFNNLVFSEYPNFKRILINSNGGDVALGFAIGDIISSLDIETVGMGRVDSMAAYLFSLGRKRLVLPSTAFLVHAGYAYLGNNSYNTVRDFQEFWIKDVNRILDTILSKITAPKKHKLKESILTGKDFYFNAEEAVKLRFAHKVVSFKDLLPRD